MRILLTNDDGPFGPGLLPLRAALSARGQVTIICPAVEHSGASHAITVLAPLHARRVALADGLEATLVNGTPADCVKFAVLHNEGEPFDLVVSGINMGINVGVDVFYSGTAAAAIEAALHGIAAMAVSTPRGNAGCMEAVARQALRVLEAVPSPAGAAATALNVNIPALGDRQPEIRLTRQSSAFDPGVMKPVSGSRHGPHYWLDQTAGGGPADDGSDVAAVQAGCISVTPLRINLTDDAALHDLARAWRSRDECSD